MLESLFNKESNFIEKRLQHSCFLCKLRIFICFEIREWLLLIILLLYLFIWFQLYLYNYEEKLWSGKEMFVVKIYIQGGQMFIEIRLCDPMTYDFKGHVKIVETYMVKFNVSILNRLKIMGFIVKSKYMHKYIVTLNKTVTKLFTILTNFFFHIWTLQATLKDFSNLWIQTLSLQTFYEITVQGLTRNLKLIVLI